MTDQVLTSEEVDAILEVTKDSNTNNVGYENVSGSTEQAAHSTVTGKLAEAIRFDYEKSLSAFLRKKVFVKLKGASLAKVSDVLKGSTAETPTITEGVEAPTVTPPDAGNLPPNIYSIFRLTPTDSYGMCVLSPALMFPIINLLFGGQPGVKDAATEAIGKMGIIIAEKLSQLLLASLVQSCQDYGTVSSDVAKTTMTPHLISHVSMDDNMFAVEMTVTFDDQESPVTLLMAEEFLQDFVFVNFKAERKHREKDFWRTAIKTQVVDSLVNVAVTLPDVQIKVNEFMGLKAGDVIPISDPTLVYICLNSLKLFRAKAGQSNSKRVVKILSQI
jgi:flagellar motor switch protein FliM